MRAAARRMDGSDSRNDARHRHHVQLRPSRQRAAADRCCWSLPASATGTWQWDDLVDALERDAGAREEARGRTGVARPDCVFALPAGDRHGEHELWHHDRHHAHGRQWRRSSAFKEAAMPSAAGQSPTSRPRSPSGDSDHHHVEPTGSAPAHARISTAPCKPKSATRSGC